MGMTSIELIAASEDLKTITQNFRSALEKYVSVSYEQVRMIRQAANNNGLSGDNTPAEIKKAVELKLKDAERQLVNLESLIQALKDSEQEYAAIMQN